VVRSNSSVAPFLTFFSSPPWWSPPRGGGRKEEPIRRALTSDGGSTEPPAAKGEKNMSLEQELASLPKIWVEMQGEAPNYTYKCAQCSYINNYKEVVIRHLLRHTRVRRTEKQSVHDSESSPQGLRHHCYSRRVLHLQVEHRWQKLRFSCFALLPQPCQPSSSQRNKPIGQANLGEAERPL